MTHSPACYFLPASLKDVLVYGSPSSVVTNTFLICYQVGVWNLEPVSGFWAKVTAELALFSLRCGSCIDLKGPSEENGETGTEVSTPEGRAEQNVPRKTWFFFFKFSLLSLFFFYIKNKFFIYNKNNKKKRKQKKINSLCEWSYVVGVTVGGVPGPGFHSVHIEDNLGKSGHSLCQVGSQGLNSGRQV